MTLNQYGTLATLKVRLNLPDTDDDAILTDLLWTVSRQIDTYCRTQFYGVTATRYFKPTGSDCLLLPPGDELLSVTSLKTDTALDRTYAQTWATTDYDLEPENAASKVPPGPYWRIETSPLGTLGFPRGLARGVQIVGRWGYYDVWETSTATLGEDLDTAETGVDVSSGPAFEAGQVIEIGSERMEISAIATNTLTVERGVNGTTAAVHTSGAAIRVATFPIVSEAAYTQAQRWYASKNMPQGVAGGTSLGVEMRQAFSAGLHPFVKDSLAPFRFGRAR